MAPGIMGAAGTGAASGAAGIMMDGAAGSSTGTADFTAEVGCAVRADFMEVEDSTVVVAFMEAATEGIGKKLGL